MKNFILLIMILTYQLVQGQTDNKKDTCQLKVSTELTKNDGEKLYVSCPCEIQTFNFSLYDRWGKLVYSTKTFASRLDINIEEKVKTDGKDELKYPKGTYFWIASYQAFFNNGLVNKKVTGKIDIL